MRVARTGLQNNDVLLRRLGKAGGSCASGGTGADDDHVRIHGARVAYWRGDGLRRTRLSPTDAPDESAHYGRRRDGPHIDTGGRRHGVAGHLEQSVIAAPDEPFDDSSERRMVDQQDVAGCDIRSGRPVAPEDREIAVTKRGRHAVANHTYDAKTEHELARIDQSFG